MDFLFPKTDKTEQFQMQMLESGDLERDNQQSLIFDLLANFDNKDQSNR